MAHVITQTVPANLIKAVIRPFAAAYEALIKTADASTLAREASAIADMSDAELAAQGLSRAQAVRNVFGRYAHL